MLTRDRIEISLQNQNMSYCERECLVNEKNLHLRKAGNANSLHPRKAN